MDNLDATLSSAAAPYASLAEEGVISRSDLAAADEAWRVDGVHPEVYFRQKLGLARTTLRGALAKYSGLETLTYDERPPVPDDLARLAFQAEGPARGLWFPVCRVHDVLTFAISEFDDSSAKAEIEELFPGRPKQFLACLREEVGWYAQDFAMRDANGPVGIQRTTMAYWRNTMALWRTKLACQRTNLACGRTWLNSLRWGLGLIGTGNSLLRLDDPLIPKPALWLLVLAGATLTTVAILSYTRLRRSWRHISDQNLVEATSAVVHFLEEFHFLELQDPVKGRAMKRTMLGRLGDSLGLYSTIIEPRGGYRERITLARERNVLAAQRTILACYRTLAARARTGLAFFRTGAAVFTFGLGLLSYFGLSPLSLLDGVLILVGLGMLIDGAVWYWPVRREYSETPRCIRYEEYDD